MNEAPDPREQEDCPGPEHCNKLCDQHNEGLQMHKVTLRDETLPHQVIISSRGVSCNCRGTTGEHSKAGKLFYELMEGEAKTMAQCRALYNDPANHYLPFDPAVDGAKW